MEMLTGLGFILLVVFLASCGAAEILTRFNPIKQPRSLTYGMFFTLFCRIAVLVILLFITVMSALALDGLVLLSDGVVACTAAGGM